MNQTPLYEIKIDKNFFDVIKNDAGFRVGFEIEIMARNAVELLRDKNHELPHDFTTFNFYKTAQDALEHTEWDKEFDPEHPDNIHTETAMMGLARLFEKYLGFPTNEISLAYTNYQHWKIEVDTSLYPKVRSIEDEPDDIGFELVSPVYEMKTGLTMLYKILNMISNFKYGKISLYTTVRTSLHINLSHINMKNFDYAKLAILAGDEHYLDDYGRKFNIYSKPLLAPVTKALGAAQSGTGSRSEQHLQAALRLLQMKDWSPGRVMQDLAPLIPYYHQASIDFSKLENGYIEVRIVGGQFYEKKYDDIAKMVIRFAGLIKIACDPNLYKNEYLKKIYQLVNKVSPLSNTKIPNINPFNNIKLFLRPAMSPKVRGVLGLLEQEYLSRRIIGLETIYQYLSIVRGCFDTRQANSLRIKQGMEMLRAALGIDVNNIIKAMTNQNMMMKYQVLRAGDNVRMVTPLLTAFVKSLGKVKKVT